MTTPVLSVSGFVFALAAVHGLGLGLVLLTRTQAGSEWSRRFLGVLILVLAVLLGDMALQFSAVTWPGPSFHSVVNTLWLLVNPLFYGYVRGLFPERSRWEPEDAVHATPVALQLLTTAAFAWAPGFDHDLVDVGRPAVSFVFIGLYGLQSVAYAAAAIGLVARYTARYQREAAGADADRLAGLRQLTTLFGVYAAAVAVNVGVLIATGRFWAWLDYLVPLSLAALLAVVGYRLLQRPHAVFPDLTLPLPPLRHEAQPSAEWGPHVEALRALMDVERPYLNPEIRLADLADRLGMSSRVLSSVLSQGIGSSFADVVNGYRVSEAQARLADPACEHFTILAIGLDSGFSSKASFNRVFKQRTGETPSAYRKRAAPLDTPRPLRGDVIIEVRSDSRGQ
ncbi:helix-turn-helix domain-containing protein [Rubrivirga sp.]|uniref:helix-turn-helix domain-containing protein n=1 Tax=Rubrivirga sp. TaxID=1885344 RepID=UPI003C73B28D